MKIPEGKVLCPGVVTHAGNIVEHRELIAERLIRSFGFAARSDCSVLSSIFISATRRPTRLPGQALF
jgi:hypothetical protein